MEVIAPRNSYYVYVYFDPRTHQPFYVGKGKNNRGFHHLSETKKNTENSFKYRTIAKLKRLGLEPRIGCAGICKDEKEAFWLEMFLIAMWGRRGITKGGLLTNRGKGGTGNAGRKLSKASRQKMSKAKKGKPLSETAQRRAAEARRRIWDDPELRERLLECRKREIANRTPEQRLAHRQKLIERNNPEFIGRMKAVTVGAKNPNAKMWKVTSPEGVVEIINCMATWAREKGFHPYVLRRAAIRLTPIPKGKAKGWSVELA
jgi:hypothetical protein